jgi:hypothetical protein
VKFLLREFTPKCVIEGIKSFAAAKHPRLPWLILIRIAREIIEGCLHSRRLSVEFTHQRVDQRVALAAKQ